MLGYSMKVEKTILQSRTKLIDYVSFIISILKLLVFPASWLALGNGIYSRIALFFAPNHIGSKSHHFCSISHHLFRVQNEM